MCLYAVLLNRSAYLSSKNRKRKKKRMVCLCFDLVAFYLSFLWL